MSADDRELAESLNQSNRIAERTKYSPTYLCGHCGCQFIELDGERVPTCDCRGRFYGAVFIAAACLISTVLMALIRFN